LQAARAQNRLIRILYASSIAVFGGDLPAVVRDDTTPTPQGSYGIQKYMGEQLVQDYTRKGFIDGRSVRIPTVVVRPGKPNGAASGFASNIIREPLAGRPVVLPVDASTAMWVASPRAVVKMLMHALSLAPSAWGWHRAINLPGLTVTMQEELAALEAVAGKKPLGLVQQQADPAVLRLVNTWAARFDTARALAMGFSPDQDFETIVRAYVEDHPEALGGN
ncbi:MAG: NAD-dependent epimerase/dehydratase family protein, partial [Burkholderiales bacterium]